MKKQTNAIIAMMPTAAAPDGLGLRYARTIARRCRL